MITTSKKFWLKKKSYLSRSFATSRNGTFQTPGPLVNEPILSYRVGSHERSALERTLKEMKNECPSVPVVIGNREYYPAQNRRTQYTTHDRTHAICQYHHADGSLLEKAVDASLENKARWASTPADVRAGILVKAADLLATKWRYRVLAATMLGQGKTVVQAEIDAAAELIDFWRFNAHYSLEMLKSQPEHHQAGVWNRLDYRPLEGFVAAISPFNFTAIGGNLCTSPALMGNTVVWKPSDTAIRSNYEVYQLLLEAGLPKGVIQFTPGEPALFDKHVTTHRMLGGLHFTGSSRAFNHLNKLVANNLENYRSFPRIVGETGGKNFHVVHSSADMESVINGTIRGAFEYQGQKCSATSRLYVPQSVWPELRGELLQRTNSLKMGSPEDFTSFMTSVIDQTAFERIEKYIQSAKESNSASILLGGECDNSQGWFVSPTIVQVQSPDHLLMQEEIFGPVLTVYVYEDDDFEKICHVADQTSPYGLTGSIWARDVAAVEKASEILRYACGNFYINDKSTGSVVGQQPFGGSRQSGTNDKAGSSLNLLRWTSVRSIKETMVPLTDISYPSME